MGTSAAGTSTGPATPAVSAARREAPPWWQKVLRVFFFAFVGTFLTTLLPIADRLAKGDNVDFPFVKALVVSAIAAGIGAGIRAVIALLPVFKDDNDVGMQRS
jgi:hypothetical protein